MTLACPHVAHTLANGLRVAVVPRPELRRAHVAAFVRIGSRFESKRDNGLSHFLEHMLFRGTDRLRDAHAVNAAFERLGASLEACTHVDYAVFELDLPRENFEAGARLLGEVIAAPRFPSIDVERGIVAEEILEDLDDDGQQVNADNIVRAATYAGHPLGMTITGGQREVERFTVADLERHHGRHFGAPSMVVVAAGAIVPEHARATLEAAFGGFPSTPAAPVEAPPAQRGPITKHVRDAASQTDVRVCFRAFGEKDPRMPALEVLMRVVDDGMATRLYRRLCDEGGLCYDTSASYEIFEDDGVVDFAASVRHERTSAIVERMLAIMCELAEEGPTEEEVRLAIQRHRWDVESSLDSAASLAHAVGVSWLFGRLRSFDEQLRRLDHVTRDEVRELAAFLASRDRLTVATIGLPPARERRRVDELARAFRA
jgi:predicted Zn-dependent peptidase